MFASETDHKSMFDVVRRMAFLAEYREPDTLNHLERIRKYTSVIAHNLGLATWEVEILSHASQLHDIGKVGLPAELSQKSGQLSAAEWEMVKQHPLIGAEILRGALSAVLQTGETIARTHHERWDGSGYPQGLKGENIALSGRITAVADVFDALTTRRPYKKELPVEDALALIKTSSGQLFDPQVVMVFSAHFEDILKIYAAHT